MHYANRKDGGTYISGGSGVNHLDGVDKDLLIDISYDKDIAEFAAKMKMKYREAFILSYKEGKKAE